MWGEVLALSDSIDLLRREIIKTPVRLVHGDSEGLAMASMVLFGELRDWDAFLVVLDRVPKPVAALAESQQHYGLATYAVRPMTCGVGGGKVGEECRACCGASSF